MWLPRKLYESLPAFYVAVGALFLSGTYYVGIDHWLMLGYLVVGSLCVLLGALVTVIRKRARAELKARRSHRSDQLFV